MRSATDVICALVLLAVGALFYWETYNIPQFDYASIGSEVWPRVILVPFLVLSVVYLVQSLRRGASRAQPVSGTIGERLARYRNPIGSFVIFMLFLLTLDYLGMLIGGILFVFVLLTYLGHHTPRWLFVHALISIGSVGIVWAVFTFALRVYLPQGELIQLY
ncbi:MAG: tripartite tricarboxylate transporter TctB family protein [Gammaproteobacteria bacterium]|nr:tripartite tricarboxylate transporter TctB family protein [Gammaproteobacteria bacterium]